MEGKLPYMMEIVPIERLNASDLIMYQCGTQKCKPGHYYGPAVRDHSLIHYIFEGKGIFQVGDKTYNLSGGQGFLICPGIVTYYQADFDDPWHYSWIGFHGLNAEFFLKKAGLCAENPIFTYRKDRFIENCFKQMLESGQMPKSKEIRLLGLLYLFLSQLIEENKQPLAPEKDINRKEQYAKKIAEFIEINYSRKISIREIARYVGLDRSYMGTIFKEHFNTSPQDYLINFRLNKACDLMKNPGLSIGDVSRSVGYDDPLLFSKMFKKIKGMSPKAYRASMRFVGNNSPS
jgi:AraC-like DNA-binding protein